MPDATIHKLIAREILDSRGNPTVEVDCYTESGMARASVPAGASKGVHEAAELRDGGKRYRGLGVQKAVKIINTTLAKKLKGTPFNQRFIDEELCRLDGTYEKKVLGANATLGVSMAVARAGAIAANIPLYQYLNQQTKRTLTLPTPFFNVINGGAHAGNNLSFQEYMIVPKAKSFTEALQMGSEVYHKLKVLLGAKYGRAATNVGDEGGFAPSMKSHTEPLDILEKAAKEAGYGKEIVFALDIAASQLGKNPHYIVDGKSKSVDQMVKLYEQLIKNYKIISIEDPFHEEAFDAFAELTKSVGKKCQIVGDDLLCTNPGRIEQALTHNSCNALLLKMNQIGTVTEAIDAGLKVLNENWNVMVSHRSGETTDDFIADLAVALGCGQIKAGAPARGERVAKYNQLLRIEDEGKLKFARIK